MHGKFLKKKILVVVVHRKTLKFQVFEMIWYTANVAIAIGQYPISKQSPNSTSFSFS